MNEVVELSQTDAAQLYAYGVTLISNDELKDKKDAENQALLEELNLDN